MMTNRTTTVGSRGTVVIPAEFLLNNATDEEDYRRAREAVREMDLDPDEIPHERPDETQVDRLFLDANVLFSAAFREDAGLRRLWSLEGAELLTSGYALEETRRNLESDEQRSRLARLAAELELVPEAPSGSLPGEFDLPEKDRPIVGAAVQAGATHLVTGDLPHFGPNLGRTVAGIQFVRPAELL